MPSPSFDDQECCNKTSKSRSDILSNHVEAHPPPPLMKEEQIADNSSRQSLGSSSDKCCQNTCSRKTVQARRRRTPHCRCEEHCRSQDEARSRSDSSCGRDPEEILSCQFKTEGNQTARPMVKETQLTVPCTTSLMFAFRDILSSTIAAPSPPKVQLTTNVKAQIVEKPRARFHAGQLRGSLISSDGCGTSTISVPRLCLWRETTICSAPLRG